MIIKFRQSLFSILFVAVAAILLACGDDDTSPKPQSTSINKIMPLGASRVEGARPEFESYRYELWKDLLENDWTFDYIGTMSDESSYPDFEGAEFDVDHEGRCGGTSGQILGNIEGWLAETGSPDIVLFSSPGGNDLLEGLSYDQAITNINAIIDILQEDNPNVTIIIEQLAPGMTAIMTPSLTANFESMQVDIPALASEQTTNTSQVIAVDMFTGFSDALLADDVHYNEAGAQFIASRYYNVLVDVLER